MLTKLRTMITRNGDVQAVLAGFIIGSIFSLIVAIVNRHGIGMALLRGFGGGAVVGAVFWAVKFAVAKVAPEAFEKDAAHEEVTYTPSEPAMSGTVNAPVQPSAVNGAPVMQAAPARENMYVPPPSAEAIREEEERKARMSLTRSNVDGLEEDDLGIPSAVPPPQPVPTPRPAAAPAMNVPPPPPIDMMQNERLTPSALPGDVDKNQDLGHNRTSPQAGETIDAIIAPSTKTLIDDFALDKAKEQMRIDAAGPADASAASPRGFSATSSGGSLVYEKNQEIRLPNNPEVMARAVRTMMQRDGGSK